MRRVAVAGVADAADQVACAQARTRAHLGRDRAGLKVRVAHEAAAADILYDAVAGRVPGGKFIAIVPTSGWSGSPSTTETTTPGAAARTGVP